MTFQQERREVGVRSLGIGGGVGFIREELF